ncbi:MAG: hypothetical protein KGZ82_10715 [Bacteroidales bacterium]|nr:hypothetical protein [Bacteroidales bacterium]
MTTTTIIYLVIAIQLVIMLLMAVYNVQFIAWERAGRAGKQLWSRRWHRTGALIRGGVWLVMLLLKVPAAWVLLAALLAWPVYNGIINMSLGRSFFYLGATAWTDRVIPEWVHYMAYLGLLWGTVAAFIMGMF